MAQLYRVCTLRDSHDTTTFSFIVPPQAASIDGPQEILSRHFHYSGHRWKLILSKRDGVHLSPYLELCNVQQGMSCTLEYSFCLVNRESFTQNERFQEHREFNCNEPRHGRRTFVSLNDLYKRRGFTDRRRNEYIVQVTLKDAKTKFECTISLTTGMRPVDVDERRYDTNTFNYAQSEWQAVFCPNYDRSGAGSHLVQLKRLNRSNLLTRLRYRIQIGSSDHNHMQTNRFQSPILDQLFDFVGDGAGYQFGEDYRDYVVDNNMILLTFELYSGYSVSQVKLNANPQTRTSASCLDTDQQTWKIAAQTVGEYVYLTLYYVDLANIPQQYLRYVRCNCSLVPCAKFEKAGRKFVEETPIENFYAMQNDVDRGIRLPTRVQMREIRDPYSQWTDQSDGKYTVELGWEASELLLQPYYSVYDDISQRHLAQMRREVEALQKENQSLEKELHSFHMNISSRCSSSADTRARDRQASAVGDELPSANYSNYNSPSMSSVHLNEIEEGVSNLHMSPRRGMQHSAASVRYPAQNGHIVAQIHNYSAQNCGNDSVPSGYSGHYQQ